MHHCLQVQEIVHNIADQANKAWQVGNDKHKGIGNPTVSLALCCRSFFTEAVSVIWQELSDVRVIFKCFPDEVWTFGDGFAKQPSEANWERFYFYMSKVRTLRIQCRWTRFRDLDSPVVFWTRLPLFPNLQKLHISSNLDLDVITRFLLSPSITEFALYCNHPKAGSLVRHVSERCPSLQKLAIQNIQQPEKSGISRDLDDVIGNMTNLRTLSTSLRLSPSAMQKISAFHDLHILECRMADTDTPGSTLQGSGGSPFASLRVLRANIKSLTNGFLESLADFKAITNLSISISVQPSPQSLHTLFTAIASTLHLTHLEVRLLRSTPLDLSVPSLADTYTLTPLHGLALHTLDLSTVPFALSNDACGVLAAEFGVPAGVRVLRLGQRVERETSHVTVRGLEALAAGCPALTALGMQCTFKGLRDSDLASPSGAEQRVLRTLELGVGVPPDGPLAAAALSAIFPAAVVSCGSGQQGFSVPKTVDNAWKTIQRVKQVMDLVRAQERLKVSK